MVDVVSHICGLIDKLRDMRYPTMVVALEDGAPVTETNLRAAAEKAGLRALDYRSEILDSDKSTILLGAYLRTEFRDWLKQEARKSGGLLVYDADELISSWPDGERRAFFLDFLHIESNMRDGLTRAPIVLASYHASRFSLPQLEQGQGIVWTPDID